MNSQLLISIILGIVCLGCIIYALIRLLKISKLDGLRNIITELITKAEELYNKGENEKKFNFVFEKAYELLPASVRLIISEETLKNFIQLVFDGIKVALDYNKGE
jgi:hypothetical protein